MAYTATKTEVSVFGNKKVWEGTVTADAASGVVSFGLYSIDHVLFSPQSAATGAPRVRNNALGAGTASAGDLGWSGCASGDVFYVTVFGH